MNYGKVLLVYPPNQLMEIETPRPDGSLGPLYLAGALKRAGFEADILDASVGAPGDDLGETFYRTVKQGNGLIRIGLPEARIRDFIAQGGYGVVGINSNFTPQTRMALEVARAAKAVSKKIFVMAGGVNARNLPERFLGSGFVDAVCLTEGERILVNTVRALERGRDWRKGTGIAFLRRGKMVRQAPAPKDVSTDLDELPVPEWDLLPFEHYERIASPHAVIAERAVRYAPIQTSRGCPFRCEYCHISAEKARAAESGGIGALRFKSFKRVSEELRKLHGLGVRKLFIEDDSLFAKKDRAREILVKMGEYGFKIADVNGVNLVHLQKREGSGLVVDREFLAFLKSVGFDQIVFPVESASQRILDKYATGKLNHALLDVVELVKTASEVGIICPINIMIGFPDETEAEMRQSIELGRKLIQAGAAYCTFFIPIPFPGSMLYDYAVRNRHLSPDFDTDILNWKNAVMKNTAVPPERVLELRDWGWQYANTKEHIRARLEASAGHRWQSGAAKTAV